MSRENEITIEVYERFGDKYLERRNLRDGKNDRRQEELLKTYVKGLPKNAKIFEVGSAGGKDAKYLRSLGYENIIVSDVVNYFLGMLESEGFAPIRFNLIEDDFKDEYDFILCWAVLPHFTKDEAKVAIVKMFEALKPNGRVVLCVKHKEGHEEDWGDFNGQIGAKRYFSYWEKDELDEHMQKSGFKNIRIQQHGGARACWLECYADK